MTIPESNLSHQDGKEEKEIRRTLGVLAERGAVIEVRTFGGGPTISGYFDNREVLVKAALGLERGGCQVYVTMNEVDPELMARAANELVSHPQKTTSDADILRRRWLLVDVDPVRPSGVSATREEKKAAREKGKEIYKYLRKKGWPDPVVADSGNGVQLLYMVDLQNDAESSELVKNILESLAFKFDDARAKVDMSVHNAARLIRLYGTTNRKGDHTDERPHRRSKIKIRPKEV
ncbi:MAG: hypothetical protein ACR2N0_08180 [Rubrobacteraceae bacterium]|jgi:hypothetical protein|nr:hypothetical protein [Actinomycetota bacterium]